MERAFHFAMSQEFRLLVLEKFSPTSHAYIGEIKHKIDAPSTITVELLEEVVQDYIKSRQELNAGSGDVDDIDFVVYKVR